MTTLSVARVNALPGVLAPSTLYVVKTSDAALAELHFSNSEGTAAKRLITKGDIETMLTTASVATSAEAVKLATARVIALSNGATGSASFDGTGNIDISVTVDPTKHTHTAAQITGLQAAIDTSVTEAMKNTIHPFLLMGAANG